MITHIRDNMSVHTQSTHMDLWRMMSHPGIWTTLWEETHLERLSDITAVN
jgi:hypothetical protein